MGNCSSLQKKSSKHSLNPKVNSSKSTSIASLIKTSESPKKNPVNSSKSPKLSKDSSSLIVDPKSKLEISSPSLALESEFSPYDAIFNNSSQRRQRRKALYERNKRLSSRKEEKLSLNNLNRNSDDSPRALTPLNPFLKISKSFDGSSCDQSRIRSTSFLDDDGFKDFLQNKRAERKSKNSLKRLNRISYKADLIPEVITAVPSLDINILYTINQECEGGSELIQRFESKGSNYRIKEKKSSLKSLSCHDLENISLKLMKENKKSDILMFFVPFVKNISEMIDYRFISIGFHDFECFYKNFDDSEQKSHDVTNNFIEIIKKFPNRWNNAIVPYCIEKNLMFLSNPNNETIYNVIFKSLQIVESQTIIRFVAYNPKEHFQYLSFNLGKINHSYLGTTKGKNQIRLTEKAVEADVLHQLMHSFGFMHMHQKLNKESFDYISKSNIRNSTYIDDESHACFYGLEFGPFDADSVLMWPSCENMISSLQDEYKPIIQLSKIDCLKVNFFYDDSNFELSSKEIKKRIKTIRKEGKINYCQKVINRPHYKIQVS